MPISVTMLLADGTQSWADLLSNDLYSSAAASKYPLLSTMNYDDVSQRNSRKRKR